MSAFNSPSHALSWLKAQGLILSYAVIVDSVLPHGPVGLHHYLDLNEPANGLPNRFYELLKEAEDTFVKRGGRTRRRIMIQVLGMGNAQQPYWYQKLGAGDGTFGVTYQAI